MLKFVRPNEDYMKDLASSLAEPISIKDRDHRWVYLNDAYCTMTGRKSEELIGKTDYDFFPVEESDAFWEKDELIFKSGNAAFYKEEIMDASEKRHTILTKKVLHTDPAGALYIVAIFHDITELDDQNAKTKKPHFSKNNI